MDNLEYKLHYIKMTSILPEINGDDYETFIQSNSKDVNLK